MATQLTIEQKQLIADFLSDPERRLNSLYWILDKDGKMRRFSMNWAQLELHRTKHKRNLILKVRQLGISTYVAIYTLDSCLFTPNFQAAIVDKKIDDACDKIAKIEFAYRHLDYLPPDPTPQDIELAKIGRLIKDYFGQAKPDGTIKDAEAKRAEMRFTNGSRIQASTSARSRTLQLLHVSELGYISVHEPLRAKEIVSGSFNSVGKDCLIFAESTHEGGKYGKNYELVMSSMANNGKTLTPLDFKFYFFPWWKHPEYVLSRPEPSETPDDASYFTTIEQQCGITLTPEQREWYATMQRTQGLLMRQEYPSTPEEAINPIPDGTIYSSQLIHLRERGHYAARFEHDPHRPIYTTWDLGIADYMSIWWLQPDGAGKWLVLDCYTANSKPIAHYIGILRERDARYGRCALCVTPHDGSRRDFNLQSFDDALRAAGYAVTRIPRTANLWLSIDNTRQLLDTCIFHDRCSQSTECDGRAILSGMDALSNYRLAPPGAHGNLGTQPLHDECSHAADALRTFADAVKLGYVGKELAIRQSTRATREEDRHQRAFINSILSI